MPRKTRKKTVALAFILLFSTTFNLTKLSVAIFLELDTVVPASKSEYDAQAEQQEV